MDDEVDNFCETITAKGDENNNEIKREKIIANQWMEHYFTLGLKAVYNRITEDGVTDYLDAPFHPTILFS